MKALILATGLVLTTGAVGWTAAQLLADRTPSGSSSDVRALVAEGGAPATLRRETRISPMEPASAEPLFGRGDAAESTAPAQPSPSDGMPSAHKPPALTDNSGAAAHQDYRALAVQMSAGSDDDDRLGTAQQVLAAHGTTDANNLLLDLSLAVLAELDPDSIPATLNELQQSSPEGSESDAVLAQALGSLARHHDVLSSEDLSSCYESGSRQMQLAAASALASRGDDSLSVRLQERCTDELGHADGEVRAAAVRDLAAQRSPALLELLVPLLDDAQGSVRLQSLRALERSDDPAVMQRVRSLVEDPAPDVRRAAQRAVMFMDDSNTSSW